MLIQRLRCLGIISISIIAFLQIQGCAQSQFIDSIAVQAETGSSSFSFIVACDMRGYVGDNPDYFRGACEAIKAIGSGEFMLSPGDIDPPDKVFYTIQTYIDQEYTWYPVVGNHEIEAKKDMDWLRQFNAQGTTLSHIVNSGPKGSLETTYSFDYSDIHFTVLNQYYDGESDSGTNGDVSDPLYVWLLEDLERTAKPIKIVVGHEPAYPEPDEDSKRLRHEADSLNEHPKNRDRFWQALVDNQVMAYMCGHTHNFSMTQFDGVWQIDTGHARGTADKGAPSTFLKIRYTEKRKVWCDVYRLDLDKSEYVLTQQQVLN
jgi:predicted phosphodiesterase